MSDKPIRLIPYEVRATQEKADTIPKGVEMIQADVFWDEGYTGEGVVIAVLDTGIDTTHPDLRNRIIDGKNFTSEGELDNFKDYNGHGTHVAGTISASENKIGIVGVAPKVKLLVCKVMNKDGIGTYQSIIDAIDYATKWEGPNGEKVRVITMSLGGPDPVDALERVIQRAIECDIAVVVAGGNEGDAIEETYEFSYPAYYNQVISVSAVNNLGELAPFSNNNTEIDIVAPGVDVLSTWIDGRYSTISGTSMATPHVAGAIALLIEKGEKLFERTLTESEIYGLLVKHTVSLGYRKSSEGHGLLQLGYMAKVRDLIDYIDNNFPRPKIDIKDKEVRSI